MTDYTKYRSGLGATYNSPLDKIGYERSMGDILEIPRSLPSSGDYGPHSDSHLPGGSDPLPLVGLTPGLMSAADKIKLDDIDYVRKPVNMSPENGAGLVPINTTLVATQFNSLYGKGQVDSQWAISKYSDFRESTIVSGGASNSYTIVNPLDILTIYYWKVRYQDAEYNWSAWSTSTAFTTSEAEYFDHGPGPGEESLNYDEVTHTGYYGVVDSNDLISGDALALAIGLSSGVSINSTSGWLKFKLNDTVLFVAKKPLRSSLTWDSIYAVGAVFGVDGVGPTGPGSTWGAGSVNQNTCVNIGERSYRVRLLKGAYANICDDTVKDRICENNIGGGSEWNKLIYRVHSHISDCATDDNKTSAHGGPQIGTNWATMSDSDLVIGSGDGRYTWCQETQNSTKTGRVARGGTRLVNFAYNPSNDTASFWGWRPCLELIQPS